MIAVALKGLLGRKVRAFLTGFAVVLGVAMVSGTFVLTDTISKAFDQIFNGTYENTSAVISGKEIVGARRAVTRRSLPRSSSRFEASTALPRRRPQSTTSARAPTTRSSSARRASSEVAVHRPSASESTPPSRGSIH